MARKKFNLGVFRESFWEANGLNKFHIDGKSKEGAKVAYPGG